MARTRTKVTPELKRQMQGMVDMLSQQNKSRNAAHKTVAQKMGVSPATVARNTDWPLLPSRPASEALGTFNLGGKQIVAAQATHTNGTQERLRILLGIVADYELEAEERSELVLICKELL